MENDNLDKTMNNTNEEMERDDHTEESIDSHDEGTLIQISKPYGVGIDTHSQFIQVSVIVKNGYNYYEYQKSFATSPESIDKALAWTLKIIQEKSDPPISVEKDTLSYTIESTSTYHLPIVKRWGGVPEIVNPKLAGPTHRKTDKLDATMLSRQNVDGLWRSSFIPSSDIWALRTLIGQKDYFSNSATKRSNMINSTLLKFGITIGRDGSVTKNREVRLTIMDLISEHPSKDAEILCPDGLPNEVKTLIKRNFELYDKDIEHKEEYHRLSIEKAKSMTWETNESTLPGDDMIQLLTTVPGVGPDTALIWMANIVTPRRFPNVRALCAYCGLDPSLKISAAHVTSTVKRGGNKALHTSLCFSASNLMRNKKDPLGIWGYKIYQSTGKWKKGTNAVGRRIAIALYYVSSKGEIFDYESYKFMELPEVLDISIYDLACINTEFHTYVQWLNQAEISSTQDMVDRFHTGSLNRFKGLSGKKLQYLIKDFIKSQDRYIELYSNYNSRRELIMEIIASEDVDIELFVEKNPLFSRYYNAMKRSNFKTVSDIIKAFYDGNLLTRPRLGNTFVALVDDYIDKTVKSYIKV